jgi:hypothetical protein
MDHVIKCRGTDVNNDEVQKAISNRAPLFYWVHLANGEQYLVPFFCQRCGGCCRVAVFYVPAPCGYFEEPDICTIYGRRPPHCRSFPVYNGSLLAEAVCKGHFLSKKAMASLSGDTDYCTDFGGDEEFSVPAKLNEAAARLEAGGLPKEFVEKFIELNS